MPLGRPDGSLSTYQGQVLPQWSQIRENDIVTEAFNAASELLSQPGAAAKPLTMTSRPSAGSWMTF